MTAFEAVLTGALLIVFLILDVALLDWCARGMGMDQ